MTELFIRSRVKAVGDIQVFKSTRKNGKLPAVDEMACLKTYRITYQQALTTLSIRSQY